MNIQESLIHLKYEHAAQAIAEYRASHTLARAELALLQRAHDWCLRRSKELQSQAKTHQERDHQINRRAKEIVQEQCETCGKPASKVIDDTNLCSACAKTLA